MNETNEHNPDERRVIGTPTTMKEWLASLPKAQPTFHEDDFPQPCEDCATKDARIAELERRVEELTEEKNTYESHMLQAEGQVATLRAEVERLTKERDQAKREWAEDFKVRTHLLRERDEARAEADKARRNYENASAAHQGAWITINDLRAQLAEREDDRARLLLALELIEHATAPGGGGEFGVNGPDDGYHENAHELATAAIRAARAQTEGLDRALVIQAIQREKLSAGDRKLEVTEEEIAAYCAARTKQQPEDGK